MTMLGFVLSTALLFLPALTAMQTKPVQDVWEPLRFFIGEWEGTGEDKPGVSRTTRADEFIEVFELAGPGKDFEKYTENRYRRKK